MKVEIALITPFMAEQIMSGNVNNRALSAKRVDNLAAQMINGGWVFNGDSIRVSSTGRLLDGQHRLAAIIKSSTSQTVALVTGLDDEVFSTIDVGANRTTSDLLAIDGFKNSSTLSSTALLVMNYKRCGNPFNHGAAGCKVPKKDIVNFCRENNDVSSFASMVDNRKKLKRLFSPSATAFCLYVFSKDDLQKSVDFAKELEDGYYSYDSSPLSALRDRLMLTSSAGAATKKHGAALMFKAWSMYKAGAKCKHLRLSLDESTWFLL